LATRTYTEQDIRVLEGLEAVRKRPGMYIGSTGTRGLHHLVDEVVDNAVDEALAGACTEIRLRLDPGNVVTVRDNGRGIPTGMHETGMPTPQVVFTKLHAGGKFGGSSYKVSGGLHGVGAAVVNALSDWLEVEIARGGKLYRQRFERGGKLAGPLQEHGPARRTGTTVRFHPDPLIFGTQELSYRTIADRLRELAFLNAGLALCIEDKRGEERSETFCFQGGLRELVEYLNEGKTTLHRPVFFSGESGGIQVDVALQYSDAYSETVLSFVNCICTVEGGYHEVGFRTAQTRVMNDYARKLGVWRRKENLAGEDLREGLMAVLSLKMSDTEFEGQTKTKLGNTEARAAVEAVVGPHLAAFLEENPEVARTLLEKASSARTAREAARKVREATRETKKGAVSRTSLEGKLTRCASRIPSECELFIVEGDSAGGNAKQGRDRKIQAILPLRGKPLNTERAPLSKILKNKEFTAVIQALGAGIQPDFDLTRCRYGKVILLADADEDGAHIRCLLLTFFYRFMRPLITGGRVYIARPPLYKIESGRGSGRKVQYAWSSEEMERLVRRLGKPSLQRYKGLGEMDAHQLWETTMNPETRTLLQVTIEDGAAAERQVSILMGDEAAARRAFIVDNVHFGVSEDEGLD
jgi:topoisomerase IV subunit B